MCFVSHLVQHSFRVPNERSPGHTHWNKGEWGTVSIVSYVDDIALLAGNEQDLQEVVSRLHQLGQKYGLKINKAKTKVMRMSKSTTGKKMLIKVDGVRLEQVDSFCYLGSLVSNDGRCEKEVKRRIGIAKQAFLNCKELLRSDIKMGLRRRLLNCYVWSTFLYGSEAWTLTKTLKDRINAFEMWCYRRMLKVSYKEHVSNELVLIWAKTQRKLLTVCLDRKLRYFGHIVREEGQMANVCMGKISGKRARGRQRAKWTDNIFEHFGGEEEKPNLGQLVGLARERRIWRSMVSNPQNWGRNH